MTTIFYHVLYRTIYHYYSSSYQAMMASETGVFYQSILSTSARKMIYNTSRTLHLWIWFPYFAAEYLALFKRYKLKRNIFHSKYSRNSRKAILRDVLFTDDCNPSKAIRQNVILSYSIMTRDGWKIKTCSFCRVGSFLHALPFALIHMTFAHPLFNSSSLTYSTVILHLFRLHSFFAIVIMQIWNFWTSLLFYRNILSSLRLYALHAVIPCCSEILLAWTCISFSLTE